MKKKYKLVALIGKAATGKDTMLKAFCEKYNSVNKCVSTTTRPKREGEQEGVDYFYVDRNEFTKKVIDFDMLEATIFNDWFYCLEKKALREDKINISILNPNGVRAILENEEIDLLVFNIISPDRDRILRYLQREERCDIREMFRRYEEDEKDFDTSRFDFDFKVIVNQGNTEISTLVEDMKNGIIDYWGK